MKIVFALFLSALQVKVGQTKRIWGNFLKEKITEIRKKISQNSWFEHFIKSLLYLTLKTVRFSSTDLTKID